MRGLAGITDTIAHMKSKLSPVSCNTAVVAAGQAGSGCYLTLRRLIVWLAEPQIRMRGLAGIADAVAALEGGALINAVDALAQHGDSLVQRFVSRTLQQMCQPLFQMAREWVFDGRLNNAGSEFFISSTGKLRTDAACTQYACCNLRMSSLSSVPCQQQAASQQNSFYTNMWLSHLF